MINTDCFYLMINTPSLTYATQHQISGEKFKFQLVIYTPSMTYATQHQIPHTHTQRSPSKGSVQGKERGNSVFEKGSVQGKQRRDRCIWERSQVRVSHWWQEDPTGHQPAAARSHETLVSQSFCHCHKAHVTSWCFLSSLITRRPRREQQGK